MNWPNNRGTGHDFPRYDGRRSSSLSWVLIWALLIGHFVEHTDCDSYRTGVAGEGAEPLSR